LIGRKLTDSFLETRRKLRRDASSNSTPPSDNASTKSPECPVHSTGALKFTPNKSSNAALQPSGISEARQIMPMDSDIADELTVASLTRDPQQFLPRSWTAYSTEERTTGEENIQLNATTRQKTRSSPVEQATAPHKVNYYEKAWYIVLAVFNYLQALSVSGGILRGAHTSNSNYTEFSGLFGSDNNSLYIVLQLTNWITAWAPLSSLIMTLPYTIPAKGPAIFRTWLLSPRRRRAWVITKQVIIFCIAEFFSLDILVGQPIPVPLDTESIGRFLPIFALSGVIAVLAPWYIMILLKLRRESGAS
jgi:hypothetical protein